MKSSPPEGLVPIVLAVTGHRDLPADDMPALRAGVLRVMERFAHRYPNSPCVLLTGLAEGADLLAAECVLTFNETRPQAKHWRLCAVLALPPDEFAADFETQQAVARFRAILARCDWVHVASDPGTPSPTRYEQVGHWMAGHAQCLLAIWDGQYNDRRAGTGWVVKRFREGENAVDDLLLPDTAPVEQICARRASSPDAMPADAIGKSRFWGAIPRHRLNMPAQAPATDTLAPADDRPSTGVPLRWALMWRRIDEFNRLARKFVQSGKAEQAFRQFIHSGGSALSGKDASGDERERDVRDRAPPAALSAARLHCVADLIAGSAQKRTLLWFRAMLTCSIVGIAFEQTYSSGACGKAGCPTFILAAAAFLMLAALLPVVLRRLLGVQGKLHWDPEARALDCRALAEACRVQFQWKLAGLPRCAADVHLRGQLDELEWIRQATRATELWGAGKSGLCAREAIQSSLHHWISEQRKYFSNAVQINRQYREITRSATSIFIGLAVLLLSSLLALKTIHWPDPLTVFQSGLLQWGFGMTLATAASLRVYQHVKGYREHYRNYQRMGQQMQAAEEQIRRNLGRLETPGLDAGSAQAEIDQALRTIELAGRAALEENSAWTLLHRDRNIEPGL